MESDQWDRTDISDEEKQMTEQDAKLALIEIGLQKFCEQFLTDQAQPYLVALWEAAEKCNQLNLTRGVPDTWAAALAYAFARMNFLLDDDGPLHVDRNEFFGFFAECTRSTVTQKATRIEKLLNFYHGNPEFCLPQVVNAMPRLVQLPNGLIVTEEFLLGEAIDGSDIEVECLSKEESLEAGRKIREQQCAREEEEKRKRHEEFTRKREEERKAQPDLFDLGD